MTSALGCKTDKIDHYDVLSEIARCKDVSVERSRSDEQLDACCAACVRTSLEINKRAQQYWDEVVHYRTVGALIGVVLIAGGLLALSRILSHQNRMRFWASAAVVSGAIAAICSTGAEVALATDELNNLRGASSIARQMQKHHMHEATHPDAGITCIRALEWARGRGSGPSCSVDIGKFDGFDDFVGTVDVDRNTARDEQITHALDRRIVLVEDLISLGKYGMDPETAAKAVADQESELDVYRVNPYFEDAAPAPVGMLGPVAYAAASALLGTGVFLLLFQLSLRRKFRGKSAS
ncbi:MAG: hypothetical protein IT372_28840 [Polyangiaceae bacterium]|nr:hypothetical protein [Polyangiaceae bacterium]